MASVLALGKRTLRSATKAATNIKIGLLQSVTWFKNQQKCLPTYELHANNIHLILTRGKSFQEKQKDMFSYSPLLFLYVSSLLIFKAIEFYMEFLCHKNAFE